MTFKEFVVESWNYGFPYEAKAVKNKQVVATRVIKNTQDFELAQSWFQQYLQQGCKFEKQFLFTNFEAVDIPGTVYLIHFQTPHFHAKHYVGWSADLDKRINVHRRGLGSRLMQVIRKQKINWKVSRIWKDKTRAFERWIKEHQKNAPQLCPICRGRISYNDLVTPEESE